MTHALVVTVRAAPVTVRAAPVTVRATPVTSLKFPTTPVLVPVFSVPGWQSELTACAYESLTALLFVRCHSLSL